MLFSDIEGSTRLLSRMGSRYGEALDRHRTLLRAAWRQWMGRELGTEGDSFFVVFEGARQAVAAALQAQQRLAAQSWPGDQRLSVRMGLHTGEPVPHGDGYVGMDVHRAARVAAAANGGQVVISDATQRLVREDLGETVSVTDLGWHRLKDFAEPTHLYQVTAAGMPETFPPLHTLGTTSTLPAQPTPLLGREGELRELRRLLQEGARLVTLTGVGGVGKSRLAVALAGAEATDFPDGVYFVSLVDASTADDLWSAVMKAVGASSSGPTGSPRELLSQLAGRRLLLVLDNLEQITEADRVVSDLLTAIPGVVVVATSRRPLHLRAEHDHPVRLLSLPEDDAVADVGRSAAVQMFCLHASMVRPGFALTEENASAVAGICRRLDGLPLALELAAAGSRLLAPAALLARTTSTAELAGPAADRPERHQALRDTIAWSYDLLPAESRARFRRLGVFSGGADLDAVATVTLPTSRGDPLDTIAELVDASLVTVTEDFAGELRVDMLQTVADFAVNELAEAGELADARARHASHYLGLALSVAPEIWSGQAPTARHRLHDESGNFRSALTWTLGLKPNANPEPSQARLGLHLCAALGRFWLTERQFVPEMNRWCRQALEVAADVDSPERVTVLSVLADSEGGPVSDPWRIGLLEEALAISRRIGDLGGECDALRGLAWERRTSGDPEEAEPLIQRAITFAEQIHDPLRRALCIHAQGEVAATRGQHGTAIDRFTASRDLARARGDEATAAIEETFLAMSLTDARRLDEASQTMRRVAADARRVSQWTLTLNTTAAGAHLCAALGAAEPAATLLGANWACAARGGLDIDPDLEEEWLRRTGLTNVRATLGQQKWEQALQVGATLTLEEALTLLP